MYCITNRRKDSGDFSVVVQSTKFHPQYVIDSIHEFLIQTYSQIHKKTNSSDFNKIVDSFKQSVSQSAQKLFTDDQFWKVY